MDSQFALHKTPAIATPDRMLVLENLSILRQEWEAVADNKSLVNITASVGLMLFDFVTKIGLTPEEQLIVLGSRLYKEATNQTQGASAQ